MKKLVFLMMVLLSVVACGEKDSSDTGKEKVAGSAETAETKTIDEKIAEFKALIPAYELGIARIKTADGKSHEFKIEFAKSQEQLMYGMMFRKDIPVDSGMLFMWDEAKTVEFWMKNTFIPLDILFIAEDKKIITIKKMAQPLSEDHIPSGGKVIAALEILGGGCEKLGIKEGDSIEWEINKK